MHTSHLDVSSKDSSRRNWFCLYLVTFVFVLPLLFGSCNQSVFFKFRHYIWDPVPYLDQVEDMNTARMKVAEDYFKSVYPMDVRLTLDELSKWGKTSPDIVIAVVTASRAAGEHQLRARPDYLAQTMSKLLSQLTNPTIMSEFPYSVKLIVCNGGVEPSLNTRALRLEKYLTIFNMPSKSPPKNHEEALMHESVDYRLCLNHSLQYSSPYVLMLEDDAYAREDMWSLLKFVIAQKLERRISRGQLITQFSDTSRAAFVKMMRPDYQLCYFKRPHSKLHLQLLGASSVIGTLLTLLHHYVRGRLSPNSFKRIEYLTWLAWCVYVLLVLIAIGAPCLLEPRRFFAPHFFTYVPAEGCCTQAILFPRHGGQLYLDYINSVAPKLQFPKDFAMDRMVVEKQLEAYQVLPSAFTHIGHVSSLLRGSSKSIFQVS